MRQKTSLDIFKKTPLTGVSHNFDDFMHNFPECKEKYIRLPECKDKFTPP